MYEGYSTELYHHGILGQKWGVRRFQNKDGSVTAAGAKRYGAVSAKAGAHKALAKVYSINENFYSKHTNNKALASMNREAKNRHLKAAEDAQNAANKKKASKYYQDNKGNIYTHKQLTKSRNDYRKELTKNHVRNGKDINEKMIEKYGKETLDRHTAETNRRTKKGETFVKACMATTGAIVLSGIGLTVAGMGGPKNAYEYIDKFM